MFQISLESCSLICLCPFLFLGMHINNKIIIKKSKVIKSIFLLCLAIVNIDVDIMFVVYLLLPVAYSLPAQMLVVVYVNSSLEVEKC